MVKLQVQCELDLKDEYIWEAIEGSVKIRVNEEQVTVHTVNVMIEGWEKYEEYDSINSSWTNLDSELIVQKKYRVIESKGFILRRGDSTNSFRHKLPNDLPGSFAHETMHYGKKYRIRISYYATVVIQFVGNANEPVMVKRRIRIPEKVKNRLTKECSAIKSVALTAKANAPVDGYVTLKVNLDRDVYFPGEEILCHSNIINESHKYAINTIAIKLVQNITIRSKSIGFRQHVSEVARSNYDGVDTREQDLRNILFQIPASTMQQSCGTLIRSDYRLIIRCETTVMTVEEVNVLIPICIVPEQPVTVQPKKQATSPTSIVQTDHLQTEMESLINQADKDYHKKISLRTEGDHFDLDKKCCIIV